MRGNVAIVLRPAAPLTRGDLMTMVNNGEKFLVIDAGTGNDLTLWY